MAQHNELGKWGEEVAARMLTEKGYRIIARDWKDNHKDLDIVAVADDCLVIVEVKTRRNMTIWLRSRLLIIGKSRISLLRRINSLR